jgi:hypothetical protein
VSKPVFNPAIIETLRSRVAAHNEIVAAQPDLQVKLSLAKKLYKRWHSGADPHAHALAMLDGRLLSLQSQALGDLTKARGPFDPGRHPRGRSGRFRSGGGRGGDGGGGGDDGPLVPRIEPGDPALLEAAQTQVIPEQRYSVLGPKIAGAAGLVAGAITGAMASHRVPWRGGGSPVDRLATRILERIGRGGGKLGGRTAGWLAVRAPILAARYAIPAINRQLGSAFSRPRAAAGVRAVERGKELGGRAGAFAGRVTGHGLALTSLPAGFARRAMEARTGSRIAGHAAGAVTGALIPGIPIAGYLHRWQSDVGPYEDVMFPRRVRKAAGSLWDAPAVLAKQAELLTLLDAPDGLEKQLGAAATRRLFSALRRLPMLRPARRVATAAPAAAPPGTAAYRAAGRAFARARPHVVVPRNRLAQALYVAGHGVALAGAGAGIGALSGAGLAAFVQQHPRDPRGRFRSKGQAAIAGAKTGAMIGAGLGIGAGAIAARRGQRELLAQAIERLRGRHATTVTEGGATKEINLHEAMREEAEQHARAAYAHKFHQEHRPRIAAAAPGVEGEPHIRHISAELEAHAVDTFMREKGAAMQAGAKAWYRHQLDREFEREVTRRFNELPKAERTIPRTTKEGPLIDAIDAARLTPEQKKIWDSALKTRNQAAEDIEHVYQERAETSRRHGEALSRMIQEQGQLKADMSSIQHRWNGLRQANPTIEQVREFAKTSMNYTVRTRTIDKAIEEVENHIPTWLEGADQRLAKLAIDIDTEQSVHAAARTAEREGFEPREALNVINPFSRKKTKVFEPLITDIPKHIERLRIDAVKEFHEQLADEAAEAHDHLDDMVAATEAALQGRITEPGVISKLTPKVLAAMAGRAKQAAADTADLARAHREALTGTMRDVYDQVHANLAPAQAWASAKKMAIGAADYGEKMSGWFRQHHKMIMSLIGLGTAAGIIDLAAPRGKRIKQPQMPRDIDVVTEWPDPIKRPNEALYGLSYKDRKGREKFLWGVHIRSKDGSDYTDIPTNVEVDRVRNSVRGGGGGGGERDRAGKVNVQNENEVKKAADTLEPHLHTAGPEGFQFQHRGNDQTEANADAASRDVARGLYRDHVDWLSKNRQVHQAQSDANRYWRSLAQTFVGQYSQLLTLGQRAGLLFGTEREGKVARGILPNPQIYQSRDAGRITTELTRVMNLGGLALRNADDYAQMRRVIWLARSRGLGEGPQLKLIDTLNQVWRREHKSNPPTSVETPGAAGPSPEHRFEEAFVQILHDVPEEDRPDRWANEDTFREALRAIYHNNRMAFMRDHPDATEEAQHRAGMRGVDEAVDLHRPRKGEIRGDLYKIFGLEKQLAEHHRRRLGLPPPQIGAISDARLAMPQPASPGPEQPDEFADRRPPDTPGMAPTKPSMLSPAHALGQLGTYGLSQAGYDAVHHIASHYMPGGGMVSRAMQLGLSTLGGLGGSMVGQSGGQALGRAMGDRTPQPVQDTNAMAVRQVAGGAAQVGFSALAPRIGRTVIGGAARRTIAGTVARVLGGAVGTMADPWIGPTGTLIGSTLAGALTDEGANLLYRHLSRYGEHVPQHALRTMGHHAKPTA